MDKEEKLNKKLENLKLDLEILLYKLLLIKQKFFEKGCKKKNDKQKDVYIDLSFLIDCLMPSFLAPAYHFNNYIDALIQDLIWDDIKWEILESEWISNILRRIIYQMEAQTVLTKIKTGLDRLVLIFWYYYKGFSRKTTFGRIKIKETDGKKEFKASGFMSIVHNLQFEDNLMDYIEKEYHSWIKYAVKPRDKIIHYKDMSIIYIFKSKNEVGIPVHDGKIEFEILKIIIENYYKFYDTIFTSLIEKESIRIEG